MEGFINLLKDISSYIYDIITIKHENISLQYNLKSSNYVRILLDIIRV